MWIISAHIAQEDAIWESNAEKAFYAHMKYTKAHLEEPG